MVKLFLTLSTLVIGALSTNTFADQSTKSSYAIIVSQETALSPAWEKVTSKLLKKHADKNPQIFTYNKDIKEVIPLLQKSHPKYTCFLAKHKEVTRQYVADVHRLTRKYDQDPYCDTLWAILTGYDPQNALDIASESKPLVIKKVTSGTQFASEMITQGVWYDELKKNLKVEKLPNGKVIRSNVPTDTTKALVDSLNNDKPDLFIASGHGTERSWQIGFTYKNGFFKSTKGQLYGIDTQKQKFNINSNNPKIYMPIGNCLIGHIDSQEAFALAWMKTAGVKQMLGYTVPTWYGYAGWGVLDYFVEQPGKYTYTQGFHVAQHALIYRLETYFPDVAKKEIKLGSMRMECKAPPIAKDAGLRSQDGVGLVHDRDVVAFYGDPAWSVKMATLPNAYDQKITQNGDTYTLTITPKRGQDTFKPVDTNGAQRGWRPIIAFLPHRIKNIKVTQGSELNPTITDDFILIPNPKVHDGRKQYTVKFKATKI